MAKLQCNVCKGKLSVSADGNTSECIDCGAAYGKKAMLPGI